MVSIFNNKVIAVGAHPDDIELGCGGFLAYLSNKGYNINCIFLTRGEKGGNPEERVKESSRACKLLGCKRIIFGNFPDTEIPHSHKIIEFLEREINDYNPCMVLIPSINDTHQDHRIVSQACITAFRNVSKILSYETDSTKPSYNPTFFVDISDYINIKRKALSYHKTQKDKMYMEYKVIMNLASYRGNQIGVTHAEAFETIRYLYE